MSASHAESVVPSRDAFRASVSSSVAATAGASSTAASSSSPTSSLEHELAGVKQSITRVEEQIDAVEKEILATEAARDACLADSVHRQELTAKLDRLSKKEDRLREKEAQLRDELKRKEAALVHPSATTGQCQIAPAASLVFRVSLSLVRWHVIAVFRVDRTAAAATTPPATGGARCEASTATVGIARWCSQLALQFREGTFVAQALLLR